MLASGKEFRLRLPFTPTSREIRALVSSGYYADEIHSPSLGCLGRVAGPCRVGAYHSEHLL